MPHNVKWLIEDQILMAHLSGDVTLEDVREMITEIVGTLDNSGYARGVHLIVDALDVMQMPYDPRAMTAGMGKINRDMGHICMVSHNKLHNFAAAVLIGMSGNKGKTFDTVEACIEYLQAQDSSLPTGITPPSRDTA